MHTLESPFQIQGMLMRIRFPTRLSIRAVGLALLLSCPAVQAPAATLTSGATWTEHLDADLLSYWSDVLQAYETAGSPESYALPTTLPDSGAVTTNADGSIAKANSTVVAQARQIYSYAVAFQMTGNTDYLQLAKAAMRYQYESLYDEATGLYKQSAATGAVLDAQKQAYGLLGASYLAHVAGGDTELASGVTLADHIDSVAGTVLTTFSTGAGQFGQSGTPSAGDDLRLVDQLDQLNAYMVLLASTAATPELRAQYLAQARATADYILDAFSYAEDSPNAGLLKQSSGASEDSATDYGHTIKALWFIDQIAILQGDAALSDQVEAQAKTVLLQAESDGLWRTSVDGTNTASDIATWWSYAEMDQYAAALALAGDEELAALVVSAQTYWLDTFVDHEDGGIYWSVDLSDDSIVRATKQNEWIAGFHAFEHALISYITSAAAEGDGAVTLYFAATADPSVLGYGFSYDSLVSVIEDGIQQVTYFGVTYGLTAVPLPSSGLLLIGVIATLSLRRRSSAPPLRVPRRA